MDVARGFILGMAALSVTSCGPKEPEYESSRKGMPKPVAGLSMVQPIMLDIRFADQGKDAVATLAFFNRGNRTEEVDVEYLVLNGIEPSTPIPNKISVPMRTKKGAEALVTGQKVMKLVFPGQAGASYNQCSYSFVTNGNRIHADQSPAPSVMFVTEGAKTALRYDADFTNRALDVQILSVKTDNKNILTSPITLKIPVGGVADLPLVLPRPSTVEYQIRLDKNKVWKKESIFLDSAENPI